MRYLAIATLVVTAGCAGSPLAPEYTCYTQPRFYFQVDDLGQEYAGHFEVDTYTQSAPCPAVRIK